MGYGIKHLRPADGLFLEATPRASAPPLLFTGARIPHPDPCSEYGNRKPGGKVHRQTGSLSGKICFFIPCSPINFNSAPWLLSSPPGRFRPCSHTTNPAGCSWQPAVFVSASRLRNGICTHGAPSGTRPAVNSRRALLSWGRHAQSDYYEN